MINYKYEANHFKLIYYALINSNLQIIILHYYYKNHTNYAPQKNILTVLYF